MTSTWIEMDKNEKDKSITKIKCVDSILVPLTLSRSVSVSLSLSLCLSIHISFWSLCCLTVYPHIHTITCIHIHIKNIRIENIFWLYFQCHFSGSIVSCWSELFLLMKNKCIAYSFSRDVKNWNNFWRNFGRLYLFDWHFFLRKKKWCITISLSCFYLKAKNEQKDDEEGGKNYMRNIETKSNFMFIIFIIKTKKDTWKKPPQLQ